ncbi:hypothetical protein DV113_000937 [Geotrichum candidum]|uniref:Acyl-CoA desaturase n=1 Tax=Geotrichum candidum TaxID=1173061 RepID=A0A0J9XG41_GEOCN|nr:hypothetical protein DV452_002932 [Geotrichum candidum]KAI9214626.1 hypothetical protein DS838_000426 [Geotrichum bryndzae]KAF5115568.1 hypothetical protein DV454_002171 [Geotrichum candidum]KAF7500965.1 hypothetical protein DV113_000937 [Geotrichum candidum]KAI8134916.1 hypothetical protein DUD61_001368 [Geotrichum candidum]
MSAPPLDQVDLDEVNAIASGVYVNEKNRIKSAILVSGSNGKVDEVKAKKKHISELPMTFSNWPQHVNWLNATIVAIIPLIGICLTPFTPLSLKTAIWAFTYYFLTGLGITAGYHRLWAHRAYSAALPLRVFLAFLGSGAAEGSIKWWSNGHRTHHRFTDTDKDPYNARRGFMFSHMGWMVFKQNPKLKARTDISDLNEDPLIRFQHRHYMPMLLLASFVFPTLVAGFGWGDFKGGFVYAGILRMLVVHQSTFCVNSLAHWIGEQPFDDRRSPRDHVVTAFATLGEGYHNFHHEFPSDYRNALKWYQYDPTKVFIWIMSKFGLAYNLQRFSQNAIEQGLVQQKQKKLDKWRSRLNWGVPIEQLPVIEFDEFKEQSKTRGLVLISGIVHDVTDFVENHPGGRALIKSAIGKDGTAVFNGGVYLHSNAAHNMLATMRVSVIRGGCEVEVWKQAQAEKKDVNLVSDSIGGKINRAGEQATRSNDSGAGVSAHAA